MFLSTSTAHPRHYRALGAGAVASITPIALLALVAILAAATVSPQTSHGQVKSVFTLADSLTGSVGGVAVDASGVIYSADFGSRVWKIHPDGRTELFATGLYGASGNAMDRFGRLLQSNFYGNYLTRIDRDGNKERVAAEGLAGPVGVVEHPNGQIYVNNCRSNSVAEIDGSGAVRSFAQSDLFRCPNGITVGPDSSLYVVNFGDGAMLRIRMDGSVEPFATIPGGNAGHIVYTRGRFYVTAYQANQIYSVSMDGQVRHESGTGAIREQDGPARDAMFAFPNGIGLGPLGDRLYVNDFVNRFPPTVERPPVPYHTIRQLMISGLDDLMADALKSGGIEELRRVHAAYKSDPETAALNTEWLLNGLGYRLLQDGRTDAAIAVFELNTVDYPNSFNVFDSLAEAYMQAGRTREAADNFRRSLQINPGNGNARQKLSELGDG